MVSPVGFAAGFAAGFDVQFALRFAAQHAVALRETHDYIKKHLAGQTVAPVRLHSAGH
jgi:hypothetical protein